MEIPGPDEVSARNDTNFIQSLLEYRRILNTCELILYSQYYSDTNPEKESIRIENYLDGLAVLYPSNDHVLGVKSLMDWHSEMMEPLEMMFSGK